LNQSVEIEQSDDLAERCVGSVANLPVEQIQALMSMDPRFEAAPPDWKSNSHFRLPFQGAESLMDAGRRVADHLNRRMSGLARVATEDTLKVFVGHGAAFRHAAHLLDVLEFDQIAAVSMWHARPVYLERFPDGAWRHLAGEWKLRRHGGGGLD
jgi:2,3-bisphosphoglycerate-dependent phosphoglycerate mutase